jgi:hypothetical protein
MLAGVMAGHLFYLERYASGIAMFGLTALFLFFAMSELIYVKENNAGRDPESVAELRKTVADLSLIVANDALNGIKRIGRTMPCTPMELASLEEVLMPLLGSLRVDRKERERLFQEFEKLKTRSRQIEGRRVLSGGR